MTMWLSSEYRILETPFSGARELPQNLPTGKDSMNKGLSSTLLYKNAYLIFLGSSIAAAQMLGLIST